MGDIEDWFRRSGFTPDTLPVGERNLSGMNPDLPSDHFSPIRDAERGARPDEEAGSGLLRQGYGGQGDPAVQDGAGQKLAVSERE